MSGDQQALHDIVNDVNNRGGASIEEKKILYDWADEYGVDKNSLGVKDQLLLEGPTSNPTKIKSKVDFYVRPNGEVVTAADYTKYQKVFNNKNYYNTSTGDIKWPGQHGDPNINGFIDGKSYPDVLKKGSVYERFGDNGNAHYYTEVGVPLSERALPPGSKYKQTIKIIPTEDIPCSSGPIAPWFDEPGGAKQFFTVETRDELEAAGKITVNH